jgi:hypothetical protein
VKKPKNHSSGSAPPLGETQHPDHADQPGQEQEQPAVAFVIPVEAEPVGGEHGLVARPVTHQIEPVKDQQTGRPGAGGGRPALRHRADMERVHTGQQRGEPGGQAVAPRGDQHRRRGDGTTQQAGNGQTGGGKGAEQVEGRPHTPEQERREEDDDDANGVVGPAASAQACADDHQHHEHRAAEQVGAERQGREHRGEHIGPPALALQAQQHRQGEARRERGGVVAGVKEPVEREVGGEDDVHRSEHREQRGDGQPGRGGSGQRPRVEPHHRQHENGDRDAHEADELAERERIRELARGGDRVPDEREHLEVGRGVQ